VLDANMQLTVRGIVGKIYVSATDSPQNAARNGDENRTLDDAAADVAALWKATCTGDIGRYDREGRVELIARDGDYVWFRGMLVNLSRIEHYLKKTGSITEVAVALSTDSSGRPELVAYIFSAEGRVTELTVVRTSLGQSLPTYMIPSRYVSVVRLPRKGNGEVDRSKLKELDQDCSSEIEGYTAPQTYLQETVCTMFSELLDVQPVGVHDNFFELGGHSLILTRLANRIKTSFGIRLPIHNLLEKNSPFQLCEMIEQHLNAPAIDSTFIEIETKPRLKRRS
jgi:pristinamycin I synthase-3/4